MELDDYPSEIEKLEELYKEKAFFELILRGVQLMSNFSDDILGAWRDVVGEQYADDKDFNDVTEIYSKAIKSKILPLSRPKLREFKVGNFLNRGDKF